MDKNSIFQNFTHQYQLSKTLRFELIPEPQTEAYLLKEDNEGKTLLDKDECRAAEAIVVKKLIDGYHKDFIELALQDIKLKIEDLKIVSEKQDDDNDKIKDAYTRLRKQVADCFNESENGIVKTKRKNLFKKELIKDDLQTWADENNKEGRELIKNFGSFTTYLSDFQKNRENMYSDEAKATAISNRLIHENLPKFIDNHNIYQSIKNKLDLSKIETELSEFLRGKSLDEIFEIESFNDALTQRGIDFYNTLIGGKSEEGQLKIRGINERINEYPSKDKKIPKLAQLFKQILSDKESNSYQTEPFENDNQMAEALDKFYQEDLCTWNNEGKIFEGEEINVIEKIEALLLSIHSYKLDKIFLKNDTSLTGISAKIFGEWSIINDALRFYYTLKEKPLQDNALPSITYEKERDKWIKKSHSIAEIENAMLCYKKQNDKVKERIMEHSICKYFADIAIQENGDEEKTERKITDRIKQNYDVVKELLKTPYREKSKEIGKNKHKEVDKIKAFLDSLLDLLHFIKPLLPGNIRDKDEDFYSPYIALYDQLNKLTDLYNKTRNYLTQKPFSTDKIKLYFENKGQFLGGWVDSDTDSDNATQAGGYLFRKKNEIGEYDFYLGISKNTKLFRINSKGNVSEDDKSDFERLDYYQLKSTTFYGSSYAGNYEDDKKRLIKELKVFANSRNDNEFSDKINKQLSKKDPTPGSCIKLLKKGYPQYFEGLMTDHPFSVINDKVIDNIKQTLRKMRRVPNTEIYINKGYKLFTEIMDDVDDLSKRSAIFSYFPVSNIEMQEALNKNEKPLLLFKITNKDLSFSKTFSEGKRKAEKRGNDNLHTLYFKQLMSVRQEIFDIGTGMVFFRKSDLKYDDQTIKKGHHYDKLKDKFDYPIIKDKRYTDKKYLLHLSIVLNYQKDAISQNPLIQHKKYNEEVIKFLSDKPNINIIGIDRGERNLLYATIIDQHGNIKKGGQLSMNDIINYRKDGTPFEAIKYHDKLSKKEEDRKEARKTWGEIQNIKELKEGYLSQVVHKIANMMIDNNAIVVMEDLNSGFIRGRQKVEKQVYEKFEKMLIDKLNYLMFKNEEDNKAGGILNAYQLSNTYNTKSIDFLKQSGFIFYVPAWNTSKIDPVTGFVDFLKPKYESVPVAQKFFSEFVSVHFNADKKYFEFKFDYTRFTTKAEGTCTEWTVCTTNVTRYTWNKNKENTNGKGGHEPINVTEELELLFWDAKISYGGEECIKDKIIAQSSKSFFERLIKLLSVTLSLRHNNGEKGDDEKDFILSPVADEMGNFFHSKSENESLPKDADANGAYHIALKGLRLLEKIKTIEKGDKPKKKAAKKDKQDDVTSLFITNKEWLKFVQEKPYKK